MATFSGGEEITGVSTYRQTNMSFFTTYTMPAGKYGFIRGWFYKTGGTANLAYSINGQAQVSTLANTTGQANPLIGSTVGGGVHQVDLTEGESYAWRASSGTYFGFANLFVKEFNLP